MDKVKLEFKTPRNKTFEYNGIVIEINPFLGVASQTFLINNYLEDYFGSPQENGLNPYVIAEFNLMNYILQLNTNVDTSELDNENYVDPILWETIRNNIINYWIFKDTLDTILDDRKEQIKLENSLGKVLSDLINKAYLVLDKISEISPEEIEKLQKTGLEIVNRLEKSSVLTGTPAKKAGRKKSSNVGEV